MEMENLCLHCFLNYSLLIREIIMNKIRSNKGFTLLEVVMLIVVLSVVGLTFGGTVLHLVRMSTNSFVYKKATILASNEFETVYAYKANNSADLWQNYLAANFSNSNAIDGFTITRSFNVNTDPITGRITFYNLQLSVNHTLLNNSMNFSTGFSPRQWD